MDRATNRAGTDEWFERLRRRFTQLARRRVDAAQVEDVVQDALQIVLEKGIDDEAWPDSGLPPVAWCFQVLRNTIGNHYRREQTRRRFIEPDPDGEAQLSVAGPSLLEAMDAAETARLVEEGIKTVATTNPQCGRYLQRLLDDARPQAVAEEEGLEAAIFYRRLYRCRQKLREWMRKKGLLV